MDSPKHIGLTLRKALAPKLCFYESQLALEESVHQSGFGPQLETLRRIVASESDLSLVRSRTNDLQPLDEFVREFVGQEVQATRRRLPVNERPSLEPFLSSFASAAQAIVCTKCDEGRICRGSPGDHEIVDKGGKCIRPLRDLYEVVVLIATSYYRIYVPEVPAPELRFSTEAVPSGEPLHGVETKPEIVVGGKAPRTGDRRTDVTLRMDVDRFNFESYLTVLYILLHECLIHAYEGTRDPASALDSFAEGWMDYVVERVLDEALDGGGPAREIGSRVIAPLAIVDATHEFAKARADYKGRADKKATAAVGRKAAKNLIKTLSAVEPELQRPALEAFFALSLKVNVCDISTTVRNAFVLTFAQPAGTVSASLVPPEVVRSLLRYFRGQQRVVDMVAEISAPSL